MQGALKGVKVLDLSRVLAGPLGTMLLADLGAEVVRVEQPGGSDDIRHWWPFSGEESTYYLSANRNKKSITLNLKSERGRSLFEDMVRQADVVVENFKAGTLARLGLSYEHLTSINSRLILCSVTGYGQDGPYHKQPGYDPVIQAVAGLMDVTGEADGEATRVGTPVVDIMTSHYVCISILAALRSRDESGKGQHIDLSLLDVQVSSLANISSSYLMNGHVSKRAGNAHGNITPYETFLCRDKPLMIAAGNDRMFAALCNVIGQESLAEDPRFRTNADRIAHRSELRAILESVFKTERADAWAEKLAANQVPCGPVNNIEQVFQHDQVKHRDMVVEHSHSSLGTYKGVRNPILSDGHALDVNSAPPTLGEHTASFLSEWFNFDQKTIDDLKKRVSYRQRLFALYN
ncbi:CaiB/BaiF CoA-transferase family protein [Geomicrobium sp. JCM 19039]|uniref:CaiB/BaiF CoA transferase family protein n=1 Tax=Geomicrobium sp. JCM 19039 TaxID=1460636 RepID=UPI00045F38D9|nr:CoA transferase [Geomicrobium sp. JCM 19039]GAK13726.1 L-carnitine dehydratase/bile acid-inducible protein F [Geomicrobium sp. JCM 19039]